MKPLLLSLVFFLFLSCTHVNKKIDSIPLQSNKSQVIKKLGLPYKIDRKFGYDHWSYKFVLSGRHYTRALLFKDGRLYGKSKLKPFSLSKGL